MKRFWRWLKSALWGNIVIMDDADCVFFQDTQGNPLFSVMARHKQDGLVAVSVLAGGDHAFFDWGVNKDCGEVNLKLQKTSWVKEHFDR